MYWQEITTVADVKELLQKLTAFTKVDCWRDGYRAYRLDVEDKIRPRGGWKISTTPTLDHETLNRHAPRGIKRHLLVEQAHEGAQECGADAASSSLGSCPPSPSTAGSGSGRSGDSSPNKRPRIAAAAAGGRVEQKGMVEWLKESVGLTAALAHAVLACFNDEEWGVRTIKMLCALSDADVEEMLAPLQDPETTLSLVRSVRALR